MFFGQEGVEEASEVESLFPVFATLFQLFQSESVAVVFVDSPSLGVGEVGDAEFDDSQCESETIRVGRKW